MSGGVPSPWRLRGQVVGHCVLHLDVSFLDVLSSVTPF